MFSGEWTQLGSWFAGIMFLCALMKQYLPRHLREHGEILGQKLMNLFDPYIRITFHEFDGKRFERCQAFSAIQTYLGDDPSKHAKRLKAEYVKGGQSPLVLSMDDYEEVKDFYEGAEVWWSSGKRTRQTQSFTFYPVSEDRRYFTLTFHKRHKKLITESYVKMVLEKGREIKISNRKLKLYTNNSGDMWTGDRSSKWTHVTFEHPATFQTIAMDPKKKEEIVSDLLNFSKGKEYYTRVGKAWKRGYLLYGPPGTGKSSLIAAMANLLNYDVYDLELTSVKDNTELRHLLIETPGKAIIVIEDIDCSLDLTGRRKKKGKDRERKKSLKNEEEKEDEGGKVTLSGLLNFIDGIWSSCGGERIIVFTTNHVDKLDPALIRRGRMDKHIELSYCCYEGFKLLAKNYLDIESHHLFARIGELLAETNMTPADVAENLLSKSKESVESCLKNLIEALETAKKEATRKEGEEAVVDEEKEEEISSSEEEEEAGDDEVSPVKENGSH